MIDDDVIVNDEREQIMMVIRRHIKYSQNTQFCLFSVSFPFPFPFPPLHHIQSRVFSFSFILSLSHSVWPSFSLCPFPQSLSPESAPISVLLEMPSILMTLHLTSWSAVNIPFC